MARYGARNTLPHLRGIAGAAMKIGGGAPWPGRRVGLAPCWRWPSREREWLALTCGEQQPENDHSRQK